MDDTELVRWVGNSDLTNSRFSIPNSYPRGTQIAICAPMKNKIALAEARGSESRVDFIHKMRIVQKDLNETAVWVRIMAKSSLLSPDLLTARTSAPASSD